MGYGSGIMGYGLRALWPHKLEDQFPSSRRLAVK